MVVRSDFIPDEQVKYFLCAFLALRFIDSKHLLVGHADQFPGIYAKQFGQTHGLIFVFFIMAIAAAEAAVGLAIFISLFHHRDTIDVDEANLMHW